MYQLHIAGGLQLAPMVQLLENSDTEKNTVAEVVIEELQQEKIGRVSAGVEIDNYNILFVLQIFSITFNNQQLRKFNDKKKHSKNGICRSLWKKC